ncbi:MAG: hypothetical protein AAFY78_19465 [Cyanobacteria bacterium J06648_16]
MISLRLALAGCITAIPLCTAAQAQTTETASAGNVSATLSVDGPGQGICGGTATLEILRGEQTYRSIVGEGLEAETYCVVSDLQVQDLDGNGEPEITLNTYSGGAHCCFFSLIYAYDAAQNRYSPLHHFWGNGGHAIRDLDQDGLPEFVSDDDRFAYAFTSYVGSRYPLQIRQYREGTLQNVTDQFPEQVYDHAYWLWTDYQNLVANRPVGAANDWSEVEQAVLAAYLADKYLLGQGEDGWHRVIAAYQWPDREDFFRKLSNFLGEAGYLDGQFE